MADPSLKILFVEEGGGNSSSAPAVGRDGRISTDPASAGGGAFIAQEREEAGSAGAAVDPAPEAKGSLWSFAGEKLAEGFGGYLDRTPFFGRALDLLNQIADHTGMFEKMEGGLGFLQRAFELFSPTDPEVQPQGRSRVESVPEVETEPELGSPERPIVRPYNPTNPEVGSPANPIIRDYKPFFPESTASLPYRPQPSVPAGLLPESTTSMPAAGGVAAEAAKGIVLEGAVAGGATAAAPAAGGALIPVASGGAAAAAAAPAAGGLVAAGSGAGGLAAGGAAAGGATAAMAGLTAALGPIAVGAIAVVAAVGASVAATKALISVNEALRDRFERVADRIRPYSGELQGADARIEMEQLKVDIEGALALGGKVAQFRESEARIDRAVQRLTDSINGPLLDVINPIVEAAADIAEVIGPVAAGLASVTKLVSGVDALVGFSSAIKPILTAGMSGITVMADLAKEDAAKLPPEADIFLAFQRRDLPTVYWRGRNWGVEGTMSEEFTMAESKFGGPLPSEQMF